MATLQTFNATKLNPLHDNVIVTEMNFSDRITSSGIILPGDDTKSQGIRPRWAKVYAIGSEQTQVSVGQYILIEHGRWTRGINMEIDGEKVTIHKIDNNAILLVSDEMQSDDTFSTAMVANSDLHRIHGSMHNS
jgi:co-chaperonin GroES (HSP10)